MQYFARSGNIQPDGRVFDERTLQAVNKTAANVTSYRELVAAIANAKAGTLITVTENVSVPETLLIAKDGITIRCSGRGSFSPASTGLTLFKLEECDDVSLLDIKTVKQKDISFDLFAFHEYTVQVWVESQPQEVKNILIRNCRAYCKDFLKINILGNAPEQSSVTPTDVNAWFKFAESRSYIQDCVHDWDTAESGWNNTFISGDTLSFYTVTGNSSVGRIEVINGTQNVISSNSLLGFIVRNGFIFIANAAPLALAGKPFSVVFTGNSFTPGGGNVVTGNWCYGYCGKEFGPFYDPTVAPPGSNNSRRDLIFNNFVLEDS